MIRFVAEFDTANAAFEEDADLEIERILTYVASRVPAGFRSGRCVDLNGNSVGRWRLEDIK